MSKKVTKKKTRRVITKKCPEDVVTRFETLQGEAIGAILSGNTARKSSVQQKLLCFIKESPSPSCDALDREAARLVVAMGV